jgi:hypothetical protein
MDSKKIKIIGISAGVLLVGFLLYRYFSKKKKGKTVNTILKDAFDNLSFEFNSYKITSDSYPFLDELASVLIAEPTWKLELSGHTDNKGSEATNLKMSNGRVEEVKKYLVSKGVSADRIKTFGYGESKPIASNDTEEGRAKNRRVEMKILKSDGTALDVEDKESVVDIEKKEIVSNLRFPKKVDSKKLVDSKKSVDNSKKSVDNSKKVSTPKVNPNRAKAINVNGVKIYVSNDKKGHLIFEDGSKIRNYKVTAKISILGKTIWSGNVSVEKLYKYKNGKIEIIDNTGKEFDGEDTDLIPLVNQFKRGETQLQASIGKADLNLKQVV